MMRVLEQSLMAWWHRTCSFETEDGSGSRIKHAFAWLFRIPCRSHIHGFLHQSFDCGMIRWHHGQHFDREVDYHWSYGDEFYEQNRSAIDMYMM